MTDLLFRDDAYARSCEAEVRAANGDGIELDRTVFYPAGGGQPGDQGIIEAGDARLNVLDTVKAGDSGVLHRLAGEPPPVGTIVRAEIDWARRHRLMRMHSALHLLCAAVAQPVTGGQIGDGKGRLDFDVQDGALDKERILERLLTWVEADRVISARWIDADDLARRPELVRTMSVRPPTTGGRVRLIEIDGIDLQACGGTHVRSTGEIGALVVGKIENKGRQNRRVNLAFA
ncbi:MAG TPA: alanyl-tRNA editing protein [Geminicoccaceae bacterium]